MASIVIKNNTNNQPTSTYQSQILTCKSQADPLNQRNFNKTFHHATKLNNFSTTCLLKLVTISLLFSLGIQSINCIDYDEQFLEQLPLQSIVSTGTETRLYTSEDFTRTCFTKIDYQSMCAEYGPKCDFKFEWSYPESLLELIKTGFDARIRVENDLPVRLKSNPNYEVYASHLMVSNIGFAHKGIWSCNFKFINQDNGKLDSWQQSFTIEIIENGVRGSPCLTNDHCSSFNCTNEVCICDADEPISVGDTCLKAPNLGETCAIDADCGKLIEDALCWCLSSDEDGSCSGRKTCQCPPSYIAVSLGLGQYRCLKKARMDEHCYRSQQCEAVDNSTYCSYKSRCSCRSGQTCATKSIRTCNKASDCLSPNEYCGNGRCQVVLDLYEYCTSSDQCDTNALCSTSNQCVCETGYKVSPTKITCIPVDYCANDLDCEKGYCNFDNNTCIAGVALSGQCFATKQCSAIDDNTYCDGDTSQCTCDVGYYVNSQNICLANGKCRVNLDCSEYENGLCYYEECIYTRKLKSSCEESRQCYLQTPYSYCELTDEAKSKSECSCLNGYEFDDDESSTNSSCKQWRNCFFDDDCKGILNSYCDLTLAQCSCNDGYNLNIDGLCYKKSLSPATDNVSFWAQLWTDYYIYIIIGAAVCGFLISIIICCCFKLCQKEATNDTAAAATRRTNNPRTTREGHDRPVTGVYMPHQPSAPPPPYSPTSSTPQPQTISRNF